MNEYRLIVFFFFFCVIEHAIRKFDYDLQIAVPEELSSNFPQTGITLQIFNLMRNMSENLLRI